MNAMLLAVLLLTQSAAGTTPAAQAPGREATSAAEPAVRDGADLDVRVREVASRLRCPVCQQLSILESPAELAQQMKAVVRERLAAGQSEDEIIAYFVSKYGEWILLDPPKHGFNLVVWLMPVAALGGGVLLLALAFRRWLGAGRGEVAADHG